MPLRPGLAQPEGELSANKTKESQTNPSKKAWISLDSFGQYGAFQRVTTNPNKKIFPGLNSRLRLCAEVLNTSFLALPKPVSQRAAFSDDPHTITQLQIFIKELNRKTGGVRGDFPGRE
jgi:hypothetical protein